MTRKISKQITVVFVREQCSQEDPVACAVRIVCGITQGLHQRMNMARVKHESPDEIRIGEGLSARHNMISRLFHSKRPFRTASLTQRSKSSLRKVGVPLACRPRSTFSRKSGPLKFANMISAALKYYPYMKQKTYINQTKCSSVFFLEHLAVLAYVATTQDKL